MNEKQSTNYTSLVDMEKEKVKNIIFILDSFCISDEAYHELTLQNKAWLNLTLLNNVGKMSTRLSILQSPGPHPSAQLDFYETIDRLLDEISNESDTL